MTSEEFAAKTGINGSLSDKVYLQLEKDILCGKFTPGESLIELKISADLGVSRTPVREAIRMLEQKGLVEMQPHRGAVVLGVNEKDLEDVYTIRMYIEGLAAKWAAAEITDEQLRELTEIVDLQEFYQLKSATERINDLDSRFHERIFEYCHSRPLQHTLSELHHMVQWFRGLSLSTEGRAGRAIEEHRRILEALAARDGDLAEKLTVLHIKNARENLVKLAAKKIADEAEQ